MSESTNSDSELLLSWEDATRALAAANDGELLGDDHVVDDLFDRGVLRAERDFTDEYQAHLTKAGRMAIVRLLMQSQEANDGERQH